MSFITGLKTFLSGGGILTEVIGIGREWLQSKRRIAEEKTTAQLKYLQTEQGFRHAWNIESIQASGKGMRWLSFALWSLPFVWAFVNPTAAGEAFKGAIEAMPDWYINGYLLVTAGVWGAKEFATIRNTTKARGLEEKLLDRISKDE